MDDKGMRELMDKMLANTVSEVGAAARRPGVAPSAASLFAKMQDSLHALQNRTNPPKLEPMAIPVLPRDQFIASVLKEKVSSDRLTPLKTNEQERKARNVASAPAKPVCTTPLSQLEKGKTCCHPLSAPQILCRSSVLLSQMRANEVQKVN
jgi:hypothetical protein